MKPAPHTFYKKRAALRITAVSAKELQIEGRSFTNTEPGMILTEIAASAGERKYDWSGKIAMAISPQEVFEISTNIESGVKLFHDLGKGTNREGQTIKKLNVSHLPAKDGKAGGYAFNVYKKENGQESKISIVLSPSEYAFLRFLLQCAVRTALGYS